MEKRDAIKEACEIISLAYHSIGDYSLPSDGFCSECAKLNPFGNYQNAGKAFDFVRRAVIEKLEREGFKISNQFDTLTGKSVEKKEI
jgi:hypothetical protein